MKKVSSFLDACKRLKIDPKKLPVVKHLPKLHAEALIAQYQLWVIAQAIRGKWVPDYNNGGQYKYYAVFYFEPSKKKGGLPTLVFDHVDDWYSYSYVGSRLCFETREDAEYFGKKFIKLHQKVHRID
jgi:hypothetical protein